VGHQHEHGFTVIVVLRSQPASAMNHARRTAAAQIVGRTAPKEPDAVAACTVSDKSSLCQIRSQFQTGYIAARYENAWIPGVMSAMHRFMQMLAADAAGSGGERPPCA
jgi:hypothetical protein